MEEKFILTNATVISILDDIRKPNGNKKSNTKSFEDIVPIAWKRLGFKGTPDPAALEELLVNLILRLYDVEKTENNEKMRKTAQNRDISLLMFGLLDGYYHTEEKNGKKVNVPSEKRYERYLNDGDFIKLDYPGEGAYQEIKIKDKERKTKSKSAQPRPLNKLTKIAGDCRDEIGGKLFELIRDKSYKEYMGGMREKNNTETLIDLPKPYYTLENFPPMGISPEPGLTDSLADEEENGQEKSRCGNPAEHTTESESHGIGRTNVSIIARYILAAKAGVNTLVQGADAILGGVQGDPSASLLSTGSKTRARIPWQLKLFTAFICLVCIALICGLSILIYGYIVTPPQIKKIDVKTEVSVNPGRKEDLELDIKPDGANWAQLSSKIVNEDIVAVTDDWWAVGLDGLGDKDRDNTVIVIWGGEAEPAIVDVTVEKPGNRGDAPVWDDYTTLD